jgi:hypothetical protein
LFQTKKTFSFARQIAIADWHRVIQEKRKKKKRKTFSDPIERVIECCGPFPCFIGHSNYHATTNHLFLITKRTKNDFWYVFGCLQFA